MKFSMFFEVGNRTCPWFGHSLYKKERGQEQQTTSCFALTNGRMEIMFNRVEGRLPVLQSKM